MTAPPAPFLYTRSSSANSSMDSDSGTPPPSKVVQRVVNDDPLAAITGTVPRVVPGIALKSASGTAVPAAAGSAGASTGPAKNLSGRKIPSKGIARGGAKVGGRGVRGRGSVPRGVIGSVATGRGASVNTGFAAGTGAAAGRGNLKILATPSPGNDEGMTDGQTSGAASAGGEETASSAATATTTVTSASTATATDTVVTASSTTITAGRGGADTSEGGKPAEVKSGGRVESSTGPPTIVSLDEMARADEEEKKRKRKARPAGKKVGWADRAGKTLQVVKEFHPDDAARVVSDASQEEAAGDMMSLLHHHHNSDHKHWVERVKREREMERKFHGKTGGRPRRGGHHGDGGAGNDAAAEEASRKKTMVPAVSWRRPGPYQEGVVHEFVMTLEVESGEAESQAARTRAGLEVVGVYWF